jgi:hypothetical protein
MNEASAGALKLRLDSSDDSKLEGVLNSGVEWGFTSPTDSLEGASTPSTEVNHLTSTIAASVHWSHAFTSAVPIYTSTVISFHELLRFCDIGCSW